MTRIILLCFFTIFLGCQPKPATTTKPHNEVLVLGTIHSGHLTDSVYNVAYLDKLIKTIKPDYILAEIPPNRMQAAMDGFKKDDSISEPRVLRFPEYVDVVFPLTKEMDFEIIATAGWTRMMADERNKKLGAIRDNPDRADDWKAYTLANQKTDSLYKATNKVNDPYFIHTQAYDDIQDIGLQMYNKLFNDELGLGGWENINIAHYWNIEKALQKHRYEGKRFLIIYGAGHKGWFLRELRKRDDIDLLEMKPFLDQVE
ncbi:hypothetical protein [uncultured Maribacter sp.]|uniref:hypothetical protein n=1 Tax=uncultured Maribacter sp. TaxID=431308 RepID=UPI002628F852|nr:hypothetical protein [uncultured Maribacter sp.]